MHGRKRRQFWSRRIARVVAIALTALTLQLAADVSYRVEITGVSSDTVQQAMRDSSLLVSLQNRPPSTMTGLRRRAEADSEELLTILHNFAYHDAKISFDVDNDHKPAVVVIAVDPGKPYRLGTVELIPSSGLRPDEEGPRLPTILDKLGVDSHGLSNDVEASSDRIVEGDKRLLRSLAKQGYPLAKIDHRDLIVDLKAKRVNVDYYINTGPLVRFGPVTVNGLTSLDEQFIHDEILWCRGNVFDPRLIEETEHGLLGRQLFSLVRITYANAIDEQGELPITIELQEGLHRTIAAGISYTTQLGPGASLEWENRNIGRFGQRLTFQMEWFKQRQKGSLSFLRPNFGAACQDFLLIAEYEGEDTKSYTENSGSVSGIFTYRLNDREAISYGATIKQLRTRRTDNDSDFTLAKLPMEYRYAAVNNLLDPSKGRRMILKVVPTQLLSDQGGWFDTHLTSIVYHRLTQDDRIVLALRGIVASLIGQGRRDIPAPERIYGGNETTLRGYKYQTVSRLDCDGRPEGGRSMLVLSYELRSKVSENVSIVGFHEFGNVYPESIPDLSDDIIHSVGAGVRYHTPVGPVRFDVAVPLNRREGIDPSFQLYFSIGQAF